jgi:phosphohistidine swiveling domain-containing protein
MSSVVDPLMPSSRSAHHWTTTNLGEAAPGVLTPLCLGLWGAPAERAARRAVHTIGAFRDDELGLPADPAEWILRPFYGRLAMQLEFMAMMGDRFPGTTGVEAIRGMFGEAPAGMTFSPTRERYRTIAWKLPLTFVRFPGLLNRVAGEQDDWWRRSVRRLPVAGLSEAQTVFAEAVKRFERTSSLQLVCTLSSVQPLYDAVEKLIAEVGIGEIGVLSGSGGAEMAVVADIWRASRGELTIEQVVDRHGFHGPGEGELSSVVWREDAAPLRNLLAGYRSRSDADSPISVEQRRAAELAEQQRAILAAVPRLKRAPVKLLLTLAARRIPLRGVAKRSFLQAIDVARASARRVGAALQLDGRLDQVDDVFMLTAEELLAPPSGARLAEIVAARRETRATYQALELASSVWHGLPETAAVAPDVPADARASVISGTGVSAGIVEGFVRVIEDPSFAEVEPDEVLVAPVTDPSWSSIMFISSALVVDIGGTLSHAAVVARELRIPCVVGTGNATRVLRTGDWVKVDGTAGTVEVLAQGPE